MCPSGEGTPHHPLNKYAKHKSCSQESIRKNPRRLKPRAGPRVALLSTGTGITSSTRSPGRSVEVRGSGVVNDQKGTFCFRTETLSERFSHTPSGTSRPGLTISGSPEPATRFEMADFLERTNPAGMRNRPPYTDWIISRGQPRRTAMRCSTCGKIAGTRRSKTFRLERSNRKILLRPS